MSIDLGALLDGAAPLVADAIRTSGTTVTFTRPTGDTAVTVDPDTLAVSGSAPQALHSAIPAIVQALSAAGEPLGPDRTWQATSYRILVLPSVTDLREGDSGVVVSSRDPQLRNYRLRVAHVRTDTAGIVRVLECERVLA